MKLSKVLTIILMIVMLLTLTTNVAFAAGEDEDADNTSTIDTINPSGINPNYESGVVTDVQDIGADIVGVIQVAGSVIAAVIIIVIGIKYMMGSAEEKAEYKKTMIPYLVGAVLIFAGTNIAGIVFEMTKNIGA